MPAVRQVASGLIYGVVSLLLVIGSLALALAQGAVPGGAASTYTPLPSSTATPRPSPSLTNAEGVTPTLRATASATRPPATPTRASPAVTRVGGTATPRPACTTPYGWIRDYWVQPGDTLFRIARLYGITVDALRAANCRSNTVIFVGERLWVPYVTPVSTELTIIPTFPTPTEPSSETPSEAPSATEMTPDP